MARLSRVELEAEVAHLAGENAELRAQVVGDTEQLKKLGGLVERLRRQGKRHSAPFPQGEPTLRPGRVGAEEA